MSRAPRVVIIRQVLEELELLRGRTTTTAKLAQRVGADEDRVRAALNNYVRTHPDGCVRKVSQAVFRWDEPSMQDRELPAPVAAAAPIDWGAPDAQPVLWPDPPAPRVVDDAGRDITFTFLHNDEDVLYLVDSDRHVWRAVRL